MTNNGNLNVTGGCNAKLVFVAGSTVSGSSGNIQFENNPGEHSTLTTLGGPQPGLRPSITTSCLVSRETLVPRVEIHLTSTALFPVRAAQA